MTSVTLGLVIKQCYTITMGEYWNMSEEGREKIRQAALRRYTNNSIITSCLQCIKGIKVSVSRFNEGRGKYCSKKCFYESAKGIRVAPKTEFKKGQKSWNEGCRGYSINSAGVPRPMS